MTGRIITPAVLVIAAVAGATSAQAKGCSGVVDFVVRGRAPYDDGPNLPRYRTKVVTMKAPAGSVIERKDARQ